MTPRPARSTSMVLLIALVMLIASPALAATETVATSPAAVEAPAISTAASCPTTLSNSDLSGELDQLLTPKPQPTTCTAQLTCWGGDVISCTGQSTCSVDCGSVLCDSTNWVECTCDAPAFCPAEWKTAYCNCRSCGGTHQQCFRCWCVNGGVNCV